MTLREYDDKLRSLSPEEFKKFNTDFGGGQKSVDERVRDFVDYPQHESRICQLLGLETEAEKISGATIKSSNAAVESAKSAKLSMLFTALAGFAAIFTVFLNIYFTYYRYDDLKATILNASPSRLETLCQADIIFTNNGNRQCSIAALYLEQAVVDTKDPLLKGLLTTPFVNQPSFTIKSNDVISKQFIISGKGKIEDSGFQNLKKGERKEWRLVFNIIDSNGKYHIVKVPVFWKAVGKNNYSVIKYPVVAQLLPSPIIEESSLWMPLLTSPPDR